MNKDECIYFKLPIVNRDTFTWIDLYTKKSPAVQACNKCVKLLDHV